MGTKGTGHRRRLRWRARPRRGRSPAIAETSLVFNVVITGSVFRHLRHFVASLIDQSDARFRLVANACSDDSLELMDQFAAREDRVIEVLEVSKQKMIPHGAALDIVHQTCDDGDQFCFVDADIKARDPFAASFLRHLEVHQAVTSGKEVWTDDNVVPADHPGLGGRHFFSSEGYVYGSPHLAMYQRTALDETLARWEVGFGSAGPDIPGPARARLDEAGHGYQAYDTAKVVNILLQEDGHSLHHEEHEALIHVGGLSHYLSPPNRVDGLGPGEEPNWARFESMAVRLAVARYAASVLRKLDDGRPAPPVPADLDPELSERLATVQVELVGMVGHRRTA